MIQLKAKLDYGTFAQIVNYRVAPTMAVYEPWDVSCIYTFFGGWVSAIGCVTI